MSKENRYEGTQSLAAMATFMNAIGIKGFHEFRINGTEIKAEETIDAFRIWASQLLADLAVPKDKFTGPDEIAKKYGLKVEVKQPTVRIVAQYQELPNDKEDPMPTPYDVYGDETGFNAAIEAVKNGVMGAADAEPMDELSTKLISEKLAEQEANYPNRSSSIDMDDDDYEYDDECGCDRCCDQQ